VKKNVQESGNEKKNLPKDSELLSTLPLGLKINSIWEAIDPTVYDVTVGQLEQIPQVPTVLDKEIVFNLHIQNTGKLDFADGMYIKNVGDWSQKFTILSLKVKEEYEFKVTVKNPKKSGKYESKWIVAFRSLYGDEITIGKPFFLKYEVNSDQQQLQHAYSEVVLEKAKRLKTIFPNQNLDYYCHFVQENGNAAIEDLIEILFVSI